MNWLVDHIFTLTQKQLVPNYYRNIVGCNYEGNIILNGPFTYYLHFFQFQENSK